MWHIDDLEVLHKEKIVIVFIIDGTSLDNQRRRKYTASPCIRKGIEIYWNNFCGNKSERKLSSTVLHLVSI